MSLRPKYPDTPAAPAVFPILTALAVVLALSAMPLSAAPLSAAKGPAPEAGIPVSVRTQASEPAKASDPAKTVAPRPGAEAPAFSLSDAQGKLRSLADYRGKWVVLEWVNYDCPFVNKHYGSGNMQKLQSEARSKGVVWLSVNSSAPGKQGHFEGAELARRMADAKAAPDAYLLDPEGKVGKAYLAKTTPTLFVINPEGMVVYAGAIDDKPSTDQEDIPIAKNFVRAALGSAMAGKPVETASAPSYGCGVKYKD
jgi:peroxiredoxin